MRHGAGVKPSEAWAWAWAAVAQETGVGKADVDVDVDVHRDGPGSLGRPRRLAADDNLATLRGRAHPMHMHEQHCRAVLAPGPQPSAAGQCWPLLSLQPWPTPRSCPPRPRPRPHRPSPTTLTLPARFRPRWTTRSCWPPKDRPTTCGHTRPRPLP